MTNGRQDLVTNRPDLVTVYTGRTLSDALSRTAAKVTAIDGASRTVTLRDAVPPDYNAYATFWYNRLTDDTFILTCKVPGAIGAGTYEVLSSIRGENLYQVKFGTKTSLSDTVVWPRGSELIPDAFHTGDGTPVSETVTVTFDEALASGAYFVNKGPAPYSFFATYSATWVTKLNGSDVTTNLAAASPAILVSRHVTPLANGKITIPSGGLVLNLTIDADALSIPLPAGDLLATGAAVSIGGQTGVLANVLSVASGVATLTGLTGMTADSVGNVITISGAATGGNNGTFSIVEYVSATSVKIQNAAAVGPDANNGAITWFEKTPSIVGAINAFTGASTASASQLGGTTADWVFRFVSPTTPTVLPAAPYASPVGFDEVSLVRIDLGTAETTLGFVTLDEALGTVAAINKPATLLGTNAGPYNITAGLNDTVEVRVNGLDYAVTLTAGAARTTTQVVANINAVVTSLSSVGTADNLDLVRLTAPTNDAASSLLILGGTALDTLGFVSGDVATQTLVTAEEVCTKLNGTGGFASAAVARATVIEGQSFITIESITVGTGASIAFTEGSNSAFNVGSGTGIVAGTDGDVGDAVHDIFVVSSDNPDGSAGEGVPGQTYTDEVTGLRFSVLPAADGSYTAAGSFTLLISPTFQVSPVLPLYALPGLEMIVSNTVDVGVNDTATVQTFNPSGSEPANGDIYYLSYRYMKQDFSARVFRQYKALTENFGPLRAENAATMSGTLALQNGAAVCIIKQVQKATGSAQASDLSFIEAITGLVALAGNVKPSIISPMATSSSVFSFLTQHCEIQSQQRQAAERMGFIGTASGTLPSSVQSLARGLSSSRIVLVYPDSAVISIDNELGQTFEQAIAGMFLASALAGSACSAAYDVATPYSRRRINGITRLIRQLDVVDANQTAVAGVTLLEDLDPIIRVRQGLTTNMASPLTWLPTVIQIGDYMQQQTRGTLDAFIGSKFLPSRAGEVEVAMNFMSRSAMSADIIATFTGISATPDPADPTGLKVKEYYVPIFPLLFIGVTLNVRSKNV